MTKSEAQYSAIQDSLRQRLLSGALTGLLPGVRQLAREYDVNFMTVNKAINRLEQENLVYRIPRKGTFVRQQRNILVAYNDASPTFFENDFYASFISGIQQELARSNCFMIYEPLSDKKESTLKNLFTRVDGMIFFGQEFPHLHLLDKPIVKALGLPASSKIDSITYDNNKIGQLAADYLTSLGHTVSAHVGCIDSPLFSQRAAQFDQRLKDSGQTCISCASQSGNDKNEILQQLAQIKDVNPFPSGFFCSTDYDTFITQQFLTSLGKNNQDFTIIGCNNSQSLRRFFPGTTPASIDLRQKEIGKLAAQQLLKRIDGLDTPPVSIMLTPNLVTPDQIEKESC